MFSFSISEIKGSPFSGLGGLSKLTLYQNRMHELNSDAFIGIGAVKSLDLSENIINSLGNNVFIMMGNIIGWYIIPEMILFRFQLMVLLFFLG